MERLGTPFLANYAFFPLCFGEISVFFTTLWQNLFFPRNSLTEFVFSSQSFERIFFFLAILGQNLNFSSPLFWKICIFCAILRRNSNVFCDPLVKFMIFFVALLVKLCYFHDHLKKFLFSPIIRLNFHFSLWSFDKIHVYFMTLKFAFSHKSLKKFAIFPRFLRNLRFFHDS